MKSFGLSALLGLIAINANAGKAESDIQGRYQDRAYLRGAVLFEKVDPSTGNHVLMPSNSSIDALGIQISSDKVEFRVLCRAPQLFKDGMDTKEIKLKVDADFSPGLNGSTYVTFKQSASKSESFGRSGAPWGMPTGGVFNQPCAFSVDQGSRLTVTADGSKLHILGISNGNSQELSLSRTKDFDLKGLFNK